MSSHLLPVRRWLKPTLMRASFSIDSRVWSRMAGNTRRCLSGAQATSVTRTSTHSVGPLPSSPFVEAKKEPKLLGSDHATFGKGHGVATEEFDPPIPADRFSSR